MKSLSDDLNQWWTSKLLGQQRSAHPVFGESVKVNFEDGVVTLAGTVETVDEAQQLEAEARSLDAVRTVVNRLQVADNRQPYHMQTVLALFPDSDSARLACQLMSAATFHNEGEPVLLDDRKSARELVAKRARAAQVPGDAAADLIKGMVNGRVLYIDRVPEDDALRVISELEGSRAEKVKTLPPEPHARKGKQS